MREQVQTYAITIVCAKRERLFLYSDNAPSMVALLARYRSEGRFHLHAFVLMPDHMHVLVSPAGSLEQSVGLLKGGFSFAIRKTWRGPIWQDSYYAHRVINGRDFDSQVRYIEENPARQGYEHFPHVHTQHAHMLDPRPEHLGG